MTETPKETGRWCPVLAGAQLHEGALVELTLEDRPIVIGRHLGRIFACEGFCPHRGASLAQTGALENGILTCGLHDWGFDLENGRGVNNTSRLGLFPAREKDGFIQVQIP